MQFAYYDTEEIIAVYVALLRQPLLVQEKYRRNQDLLSQARVMVARQMNISETVAQDFFEAVAQEENRAAWAEAYEQGYTKGRDMEASVAHDRLRLRVQGSFTPLLP